MIKKKHMLFCFFILNKINLKQFFLICFKQITNYNDNLTK